VATTFAFDIGETLVRDDRYWGRWADWLNIPYHTLSALVGAVVAQGRDNADALRILRPGLDVAAEYAGIGPAGIFIFGAQAHGHSGGAICEEGGPGQRQYPGPPSTARTPGACARRLPAECAYVRALAGEATCRQSIAVTSALSVEGVPVTAAGPAP
jgi:hypothetical protein